MTDKMLNLEIRLLLARHSKRKVFEALAEISNSSIEAIEEDLKQIEERKKSRTRKEKSPQDRIEEACKDTPEKKPILTALVSQYETRGFLPQLREVEQFLDHAAIKHGKLKSRTAALSKVIQALVKMTPDQLKELSEAGADSKESGFAILADEIMKKEKGEQ